MKKIGFGFLALILMNMLGTQVQAQSPGTIVFCGGQTDEKCYFKVGQESTVNLSRSFPGDTPNIFMRGYFAEPLGTADLSLSLYRNGSFWQGRESNGYDPTWKSAFINLTNGVYYNNKSFPPGRYKVQISKSGGVKKVIAEGTFSIQ